MQTNRSGIHLTADHHCWAQHVYLSNTLTTKFVQSLVFTHDSQTIYSGVPLSGIYTLQSVLTLQWAAMLFHIWRPEGETVTFLVSKWRLKYRVNSLPKPVSCETELELKKNCYRNLDVYWLRCIGSQCKGCGGLNWLSVASFFLLNGSLSICTFYCKTALNNSKAGNGSS